jgi:outer membrane receptor protein involved in Fe transport
MFSDILQTDLKVNGKNSISLKDETKTLSHTAADYAAIEETISYKPEESWNYEVGTHLNLFDNLLHFDLSLYYMQIRNQQLSQMIPGSNYGRMMVNAGKSHSCGMEATLRGRLLDNSIDWNVNYSFTNAKFDEYDNYKDKYVPFVPKHMVSAMLDYHLGSFTIGANMNAQGKMWWDEANTYAQKFYALLGAHADYDFGPVLVSLWGRNITDTRYNTFAVQSNAAGGTRYFAQRGNPIQLGMDVNIHL